MLYYITAGASEPLKVLVDPGFTLSAGPLKITLRSPDIPAAQGAPSWALSGHAEVWNLKSLDRVERGDVRVALTSILARVLLEHMPNAVELELHCDEQALGLCRNLQPQIIRDLQNAQPGIFERVSLYLSD